MRQNIKLQFLAIFSREMPENLFGFVKDQDISQLDYQEPAVEKTEPEPALEPKPERRLGPNFKLNFNQIQSKLGFFKRLNLGGFFVSFKEALNRKSLSVFLLTGIILLVLLIGLGALYWFLPRAEVVLILKPRVLQKDFVIKLDPALTVPDKENLILPASEIQTAVEGKKETNTTGGKLVGEKAKGKVVIYNRTDKAKSLPAGTELGGPENLKFTLNEAVNIASESAGSDYVRIPGKAEVEVTAVEIGSEGNLASGSEFNVGNLAKSDFVAKNESSFSEGSSREIQVVAKADQDKVLAELQEELEEKAISDLKTKLTPGQKLVEESLLTQVVEKTFDQKVGDEANKVSLKLEVKATALSFQEDEFKQLAEVEIRNLIPSDFDYDSDKTEIEFRPQTSTEKGVFAFKALFKADLVPKLELEEIKKNLLGKKPIIGKTYLGNLPNVADFNVQIRPRFPASIVTFPRLLKRINIEIETE